MNCEVVLARMFSTRSTRRRLRPSSSASAYSPAPTEYSSFSRSSASTSVRYCNQFSWNSKKLPDGCSHDNDSAENGGEHTGPKGIFSHPQINHRDGSAVEKRGDFRSVETTLVPRGFFVMPF